MNELKEKEIKKMKLYIKDYFGQDCSGGCMIIAANNVKEAEAVAKKYHEKKDVWFSYEPSEVEKAVVIRYSEYHGKKAKVLVDNIVQE